MAQPALIGMLRKPSRLSGDGVGGGPMEMPPQSSSSGAQGPAAILPPGMMMMAPQMQMGMGQGQGAPTVMGMVRHNESINMEFNFYNNYLNFRKIILSFFGHLN
jgi:hypothetical protein